MVVILTPIVLMVVGIPDCIVTSPLTVGFEDLFLVTVLTTRFQLLYGVNIFISFTTRETGKDSVPNLGGGFKYLLFSPLFGEDSHFDIFQMG